MEAGDEGVSIAEGKVKLMKIKQVYGKWNFLYEYKHGDNWCMCNVLKVLKQKGDKCMIYTNNGEILHIAIGLVRKMDEKTYFNYRMDTIDLIGEHAYECGFHRNACEDLALLKNSNELGEKINDRHCKKRYAEYER